MAPPSSVNSMSLDRRADLCWARPPFRFTPSLPLAGHMDVNVRGLMMPTFRRLVENALCAVPFRAFCCASSLVALLVLPRPWMSCAPCATWLYPRVSRLYPAALCSSKNLYLFDDALCLAATSRIAMVSAFSTDSFMALILAWSVSLFAVGESFETTPRPSQPVPRFQRRFARGLTVTNLFG